MSPELFNPATVTAAASVVGYAVGYGIERKAVAKAAENQSNYNEYMGYAVDQVEDAHVSRAVRLANGMLAPLALGAAVAFGLTAYAVTPEANTTIEKPGMIEVVVDHSGATANIVDGEPIVAKINKIAGQFKDSEMHVNVVVAKAGEATTVTLDQLDSAQAAPFGTANLPQTVREAISRTAAAAPIISADSITRNAAVFVITNGNSIGTAKSVIEASEKAYGKDSRTPVFIVNEEGTEASKEDLVAFKQIAEETKGAFWNADKDILDTVVEQVQEAIAATQTSGTTKPNKWPIGALAVVSFAGLYVAFKRRGQMAFGRGIKGE